VRLSGGGGRERSEWRGSHDGGVGEEWAAADPALGKQWGRAVVAVGGRMQWEGGRAALYR
jgi:hypothetical protein